MKLSHQNRQNRSEFQRRLEAQRRARQGDLESVKSFPKPAPPLPSLFKSEVPTFSSVDELVVAGNKEFKNLDLVDFAAFRNNEKLGRETVAEVDTALRSFHPSGQGQAYREDLSRVLNARYLQGHGVQVEGHLDHREMRSLRKYFQKETSTYNVADAARAINTSLRDGEENVSSLLLGAEEHLFADRGVERERFDQNLDDLSLGELAKVRDFSDAWSTSQGAKYLSQLSGESFVSSRDQMSRQMLADHGYRGLEKLDLDTVLSLLRDVDSEGPGTAKIIKQSINANVESGESDYFVLNTKANRAVMLDFGVPEEALQALEVGDQKLVKAYPDLAPREARAIRTRVLRDLLRVLPPSERLRGVEHLMSHEANLIDAEPQLSSYLGHRIQELGHGKLEFHKMGAMQRANLATGLSKMPPEVRDSVFVCDKPKGALEQLIEKEFGVKVHREPGVAPNETDGVGEFVKDFPTQALVDLYNALRGMSNNGKLPPGLSGSTTVAYVEGSGTSPSMAVGPQAPDSDPVGPWNRPGSFAHASGKSGYYGMCSADSHGRDTVYFCDDALLGPNSDSAESVTCGESTLIHELGHAIQLGGTPGESKERRKGEQQRLMAEWSSLSGWEEPKDVLADGWMGEFEYYYDPTVQVNARAEVATSYGASDPCEDFAEYTPFFFKAPEIAANLSKEKFLYFNQLMGGHYDQSQVEEVTGLRSTELLTLNTRVAEKIAAAPARAGLVSS